MNAMQRFRRFLRYGVVLAILGVCGLKSTNAASAQDEFVFGRFRQIGDPNGFARSRTPGTGVFVNGRQLSPYEVAELRQIFGYVVPGSYWMQYDGTYGLVGGPAIGNLYDAIQWSSRRNYAPPRYSGDRNTLYVPGVGVLLPDGTSVTW
jgi:hypothetical protein